MGVKITTTRGQPAGVRSISTSEASQRLHAGDPIFAYLVGLIEGDGFFSVSKKGKYVLYELGIELSIKDVQLIYKIKDLLGIGIVGFRERIPSVFKGPPSKDKMVYFRIRKKSHLINFIIPIFDKYPLLSDKQYDYLRFREGLLSGIILYEDLPKYGAKASPTNSLNTLESIIKVPYFSAWLVGFIEAVPVPQRPKGSGSGSGCFSVYKLTDSSSYLVASFEVSQTYHTRPKGPLGSTGGRRSEILILAIRKYLSISSNVSVDKLNNFRLKVSSVRSVENIIKFLQKAPTKLLGNKKLQYLLWIKQLRTIPRYSSKINLPIKY